MVSNLKYPAGDTLAEGEFLSLLYTLHEVARIKVIEGYLFATGAELILSIPDYLVWEDIICRLLQNAGKYNLIVGKKYHLNKKKEVSLVDFIRVESDILAIGVDSLRRQLYIAAKMLPESRFKRFP